ncbi:MAG: coproporphyrinogen III oxidase [Hyphomicrobiaceae bacterium]|nr:coproporphyrinogen III oxidase [Hyphomicrobiaceae bacterium]
MSADRLTLADRDAGFGVYVHWPFCASKCPYCDFNSHVRAIPVDEARFLAAMRAEIAHFGQRTEGRAVRSIFLGGGTPSLMKPETVGGILEAIAATWPLEQNVEITLEANPSSVEAGRFRGYRAAGVNRVSLGVQALNAPDLAALGRRHTVEEARKALAIARSTFERVSYDLIYARPDQSVDAWQAELQEALTYAADHLSLYQLTIEPGTQFALLHAAGRLKVPDADTGAALYEATQEAMDKAGLPAYEISNHAAAGAECRHNLVYWRYGEYAGIGPGAHGRVIAGERRVATATERHPETWLAAVETRGHGLITEDPLTLEEMGDEYLLMALRLREGFDPERYTELSGRRLDPKRIDALIDDGLVETLGNQRLRATRSGMAVLDALVADIAA